MSLSTFILDKISYLIFLFTVNNTSIESDYNIVSMVKHTDEVVRKDPHKENVLDKIEFNF